MSPGTTDPETIAVGRVAELYRYPVKSMLGEAVGAVHVGPRGLAGDRGFGIVDRETAVVATAKSPRRWQRLLQARAELGADGVAGIWLPGGRFVRSSDADVDEVLTEFLGRPVELRPEAAPGARLEKADPGAVMEGGPDADAALETVELAGGAPAGTFFDFSPVQFVTRASLEQAGAHHPAGRVDAARYRPNIVIETTPGLAGFVENDWAGHRLHVGPDVVLDVLIPSPRCAVTMLRHGDLPNDPDALRVLTRHNFVPVPLEGFGSAPCLGAHAGVVAGGRISPGDEVRLVL